jgi:hypothetical protein
MGFTTHNKDPFKPWPITPYLLFLFPLRIALHRFLHIVAIEMTASSPKSQRSAPRSPTSQRSVPTATQTIEVDTEEEDDEIDPGLGADAESSTASITSSILHYRTINGRTYHSERGNAAYWYI